MRSWYLKDSVMVDYGYWLTVSLELCLPYDLKLDGLDLSGNNWLLYY